MPSLFLPIDFKLNNIHMNHALSKAKSFLSCRSSLLLIVVTQFIQHFYEGIINMFILIRNLF